MSLHNNRVTRAPRSGARAASVVVGLVFLLVGVLGFIPGITTHLDALGLAGHDSGADLFGLFQVSVLHNVVHLVFGVAGLIAARTGKAARGYLIVTGVLYLLLALYGVLVPAGSVLNVIPLNPADDVLHVVLGVVILGLGLVLGPGATGPRGANEDIRPEPGVQG